MTPAVREVHVERLVGTRVRDTAGRVVGRIEEIHADDAGVVSEFLVGPAALWERLGQATLDLPFVRLLEIERSERRIPWNELDLTDPDRPIVTAEPRE